MPDDGNAVENEPAAGAEGEADTGEGSPDAGSPNDGGPARQSGRDNPLPHWRHQEILRGERARWEKEHREHLDSQRKQWEQELYGRMAQAEAARYRSLFPAYVEEEQPEYIDASTFQKRIQEIESNFDSRFAAQQAQAEFERMSARYPEWSQYPGWGTEIFRRWARNSNLSMDQIGDAYAQELEKHFEAAYARKQAAAQAAAEEAKKNPKKMVPAGGGGHAPPKTQTEKRKTVGQRIQEALSSGEG